MPPLGGSLGLYPPLKAGLIGGGGGPTVYPGFNAGIIGGGGGPLACCLGWGVVPVGQGIPAILLFKSEGLALCGSCCRRGGSTDTIN